MGTHYEWASANSSPTLVDPADLADVADDGNPDGFHGLALEQCMVYGTPADLRAFAERILRALDPAPALPKLPVPAADAEDWDEDNEAAATCQHRWTVEEVAAQAARRDEYVTRMRQMHGADANLYPPTVHTVGEVCGAELLLWESVPMYRRPWWRKESDGTVTMRLGDSKFGDGGEESELNCSERHYWAIPEDIDYM